MKFSELIAVLQAKQKEYGNLDIHFGNEFEYEITEIKHIHANTSIRRGQMMNGSHLAARLVIAGRSIER